MDNYENELVPMEDIEALSWMYPDIYKRLQPHIDDMVDSLSEDNMYSMTENELNKMTDDVLKKSGIDSNPPMHHNNYTMRDFVRAMLLTSLYDRDLEHKFLPVPFFAHPYYDWFRDGWRRRRRRNRFRHHRY